MGPFNVGDCYYVRTDTDHWLGRLVSVDGPYTITLTEAAWVADSGRLGEFLTTGQSSQMEVEAMPDGMTITVNWRAVISWPHQLLRETV
jgi:hypothetical protein